MPPPRLEAMLWVSVLPPLSPGLLHFDGAVFGLERGNSALSWEFRSRDDIPEAKLVGKEQIY